MSYRINQSKISYQEFRAGNNLVEAGLGWFLTRLRVPLPGGTSHPTVDAITPHRVKSTAVPQEILAELQPSKQELEKLGFRGTIYYYFLDPASHTEVYYACLLHESGRCIARLVRQYFSAANPPKLFHFCEFITPVGQQDFWTTSTGKLDLLGPEECHDEHLNEPQLGKAWQRHQARIAEPRVHEAVRLTGDGRELVSVLERRHRLITDHYTDRGVFVPAAPGDPSLGLSPATPGSQDNAVSDGLLLAEVRKLEDKSPPNWQASLLILVVTIALFVGAGGLAWDWKLVLLAVPILLFHELGHFLAMKLFDYRNVQMFFIPFLGAAVSGRHYDVPGWKRVVTSLMGPVPGVLLGIGLGAAALYQGIDWLLEFSLLCVVINAFNLLPSLPLDGGWVMHGLVFSRHAFLDLIFRLLAIGVLFVGFAAGLGFFLAVIGVAMIVALPVSYRVARITDRLRESSDPLERPVEGHMPADAVARVSEELNKAYVKGLDTRTKARLVLQVYENVNSRPPGWVATIVLGFVYLGTCAASLLAGVVFLLATQADLGQFLLDAAMGPQTPVSSSEIQTLPPGLDLTEHTEGSTLIVNFDTRPEAEAAFGSLRGEPAGHPATLFGSTLIMLLPAEVDQDERDRLYDHYESLIGEDPEAFFARVFFVQPGEGVTCSVMTTAPTPDTAERIASDLDMHFVLPAEIRPIPPWAPGAEYSEQSIRARQTALKLTQNTWTEDIGDLTPVYDEMGEAERRGNKARVEEIEGELKARYARAHQAYFAELRDDPETDTEVIDAYEAAAAALEEEREAAVVEEDEYYYAIFPMSPDRGAWLAPLAGKFECVGSDDPMRAYLSTDYGGAIPNGPILTINASFVSPAAGPIALVEWLESHGCIDIKYELRQSAW